MCDCVKAYGKWGANQVSTYFATFHTLDGKSFMAILENYEELVYSLVNFLPTIHFYSASMTVRMNEVVLV